MAGVTGRAVRVVGMALVLALVGAACGNDDDGGGDAADFRLVEAGKLTVCTDAPYEPFEFQDENGEFTGFDMDLLREVATRLGLELNPVVTPFDGIWLKPAAGDCDLVGSAMTITPERAEQALFTDPYFDADQSLLVRTGDAAEITSLEDLVGRTVAVQTGTTGEAYAEEHAPDGVEIRSFDEPGAMFLALESGDVDAILQDLPVNADRAKQNPDLTVVATFSTGEQYGFAVAQDNPGLAEAVNRVLGEMRSDGTYQEIYDRYFTA